MLQIGKFHETDNLHALMGKMLKISRQLKGRPVDLRNGDPVHRQIDVRRQIFQVHIPFQLLQRNKFSAHSSFCCPLV